MGLPLAILITTNVTNVLLLLLVMRKWRVRETRTAILVFVGSIISLLLWSLSNYFADTSTTISEALFWTRVTFPFALFMCWFIYFFSLVFPISGQGNFRSVKIYLLFVILFSALSYSRLIIESVGIDPHIGISEVSVGQLYIGIVLLYIMLISHTTINLVRGVRTQVGRYRAQLRYVLLGWGCFLIFAVSTNAIFPLITGNANWSKFGPLGSVLMVGCIAHAIRRHQFFDINIIIQRGVIYSVLLTLILGLYTFLLFLSDHFFTETVAVNALLSGFITTLVGIFGAPPLTNYFQKVTSRFFFKDRYEYATLLRKLSGILNEHMEQDAIVTEATAVLQEALKARSVDFLIPGSDMSDPDVPVLTIPIRSNQKAIGVLALGAKRSDDDYTKEDIELLQTFATQAGVALEKAELFAQVHEYARTLEQKVEARTREIRDIQKEQEAMMLEISHGLQTPLTIMKGELFFLRKGSHDTSKIDVLDTSINKVSFFIKRLLDLYRLQTNTPSVPAPVSLDSVIRAAIAPLESVCEEGKLEIRTTIPHEVIVMGDESALEELISNLVHNAIKYSRKDTKNTISIELSEEARHVNLVVRDTGVGIGKEHLEHLFKKFYRVKDAATKGISGTGLGLAICKQIVDMHQGTIRVESVPGIGTTFTIRLPKFDAAHPV